MAHGVFLAVREMTARRPFALHLPLLLLGLTGCARGCSDAAVPVAAPAEQRQPPRAPHTHLQRVEAQLGVQLADRATGTILPGLVTLAWRALPAFDPNRALVATLDGRGLAVLGEAVPIAQLDEPNVRSALRKSAEAYRLRAGVQANRLVLAIDARVPPGQATLVRKAAMLAGQWRVVALAQDGGVLVEVMLDPPPESRPKP